MFSKIKSFISGIFSGKKAGCEKYKPGSGKKNKKSGKKSNNFDRKSGAESASVKRKKNDGRKKNTVKKEDKVLSIPVKKEVPAHPEKLEEIETCEGKVRFLDYALNELVQHGIQHADDRDF